MRQYSEPLLLSANGSNRGTAYHCANKSVTINGKTHVVWLDQVARICGRTYDHAASEWSEKYEWFDGCDNHSNPALSADAEGYLHLAYGPHGYWGNWNSGCFKHVLSAEPYSLAAWRQETNPGPGYKATYTSLVTDASGRDCLVYRGGEEPYALMFQRQTDAGGWTNARPLMYQKIPPQYTFIGATVVSDSKGVLYVAGHFYNAVTNRGSIGAAILKSADNGENWTDLRGKKADLPILYSSRFAVPHPRHNPYLDGLAIDAHDRLWVSTCSRGAKEPESLLACWEGEWRSVALAPFMPRGRMIAETSLSVDIHGRVHVAAGATETELLGGEDVFGHPSSEIFHLMSEDDGQTFSCAQISATDKAMANWLPSISRPGPFHPVNKPVILYTHGAPQAREGEGCQATIKTEIYCVFVTC